MLSLFKELDFSNEIEENKDLKLFILEACKKVEQEESEALRKIKKPELDDELLNQFISTPPLIQSMAFPCLSQTTRRSSWFFSGQSCWTLKRSARSRAF